MGSSWLSTAASRQSESADFGAYIIADSRIDGAMQSRARKQAVFSLSPHPVRSLLREYHVGPVSFPMKSRFNGNTPIFERGFLLGDASRPPEGFFRRDFATMPVCHDSRARQARILQRPGSPSLSMRPGDAARQSSKTDR